MAAMTQRILIVEDDAPIAENVAVALSREGFSTHHVALVREGMVALDAGDFDLLILDVGLPDGNGLEVCKEIRRRSMIPIIFLTARADEMDRVVGLEIGADDYVSKPFSPRELAVRVKNILRRTMPLPRTDFPHTTPFVLDEVRACISYHGTVLGLSRAEFLILKLLLSQPERVFSRAQLMGAAELADASMERVIDTHIKSLRAQLKAVRNDADPICTHRGFGYSLASRAA